MDKEGHCHVEKEGHCHVDKEGHYQGDKEELSDLAKFMLKVLEQSMMHEYETNIAPSHLLDLVNRLLATLVTLSNT